MFDEREGFFKGNFVKKTEKIGEKVAFNHGWKNKENAEAASEGAEETDNSCWPPVFFSKKVKDQNGEKKKKTFGVN